MKNNTLIKKELRELLNNFLQDTDHNAEINPEIANAIVDVHLNKFSLWIEEQIEKVREDADFEGYKRGMEEQKIIGLRHWKIG